jgi:hypothetical protein
LRRKDLERVLALAQRFDPKVFYSVDDLQAAAAGVAPARRLPRGLVPALLRQSQTIKGASSSWRSDRVNGPPTK